MKAYGHPSLWFQGGPRIIALIVQDSQLLNGLVLVNHSGVGRDTSSGSFFIPSLKQDLIGPIFHYPISKAPI